MGRERERSFCVDVSFGGGVLVRPALLGGGKKEKKVAAGSSGCDMIRMI